VPLRLAWAITVHKSQGMSLDCAEIDLSKTFEYGMGYVALSRVRSLAGIRLLGFNEMALKVGEKVIEMDKQLQEKSRQDLEEFDQLSAEQKTEMQKELVKQPEVTKTAEPVETTGIPF
jgi:ATP-dependent exoDNAse (exonuclease V) alpha subunit